ncbi:hypothetical protein [Novosphingobium sp. 9U]|uniref:hypothetical protein n=1 Tax=Novosphingobium sp. 9U TaxID=2653158 RepID=UPI00135758CB|nr:hypothetical protein [Novosphingobium sp. 9U]
MTDLPQEPNPPETAPAAQTQAAEAAAARRRWITLAEVLTVIAVSISGLTLWNSWSERRHTETTRQDEARQASTRAQTLVLTAATTSDDALTLKPSDDDQSVQSQRVAFPSALGIAQAETTGEPRIESGWFDRSLVKAREKAGMPDESRGDERLPVAITTRFLVDGKPHQDVAIYDLGYTIRGRWLSGHSLTLRGISLVSRVREGSSQAALDARWNRLFPRSNK